MMCYLEKWKKGKCSLKRRVLHVRKELKKTCSEKGTNENNTLVAGLRTERPRLHLLLHV